MNEARKGLAAARAQEGMSTKISTTLAENERLKSELRQLQEELKGKMTVPFFRRISIFILQMIVTLLNRCLICVSSTVLNINLDKVRASEAEAMEKCKQLTQELKTKEGLVREKDDLLNEVKKDSQRLDEELNSARQASVNAQTKVKSLETTIAELQKK